ncbi:L-dopachrome tautomerase yellow-f2-like [Phlebotomus argentipes]|uniref:L-dopachrome tautomerase yellow-f2-like n=1 Tax=Phlebotomus argentipes TaxID=94469 RepID=UPI00289375D3|nr:L-dopachrome tautomerase yellow-f2-like [Phlebotomus argentipes]
MVVVIVRIRPGVPTSLAAFCASDYSEGSSPKIWGFPNYEINALRDSDFIGGPDEEGRKFHSKPNKYHHGQSYYTNYGGNYQNYHHGHYQSSHQQVQVPIYQSPITKPPPPQESTDRIISVCYLTMDEKCNRLFTMDNGHLYYYHNTTYLIKNPTLTVIGIPSNGCKTRNFPIIRLAEFPDSIAARGSYGFMVSTLDYQESGSCDDLFVYIANAFSSYLTVYDYKNDDFWYFDHETFFPVIAESHFVFDRTYYYDLPLGMYSIALGYADKYGDRTAYYTTVASTAQYKVSTRVLKDRRRSPTNYNNDDFSIMGHRGCGHESCRTAIDYAHGVMFYAEVQSNQIRCWKINKPLNPDNVDVVYESDDLLYGINIFIDSWGYLWFHTCYIPILFTSDEPLNLQNINSRTFRMRVTDAIRGTICEDE